MELRKLISSFTVSALPFFFFSFLFLTVAQIIAVITPYMVDSDKGNLGARVFFIWGSLCACCFAYAYFLVFETKGLSLEQVDKMMEESTPLSSSKWKPHGTFAADMGFTDKGSLAPEVTHHEETKV
jgi:hypothetical protein